MLKNYISDYIQAQKEAYDLIPQDKVAELIEIYRKALHENRQIFTIGNGGSASNSSHFIVDLSKLASDKIGKRFRANSLNENIAWITALGNDYDYSESFARQLMNFGNEGDLLMALSVSGNSPNLVKAFEWAKQNGLFTIALVGGKQGKLSEIADFCIVIDSEHYGRVEDAQMTICHIICYAFVENPQLATSQ